MIKFLTESFEKACSVLAWLNLFFCLIIGVVGGVALTEVLNIYPDFLRIIVIIGIALAGLLFGFIVDILFFGIFAQIISIRKRLETLTVNS